MIYSVTTLALVSCLTAIWAFPNGAPNFACGPMVPGHLPTTTSGNNPFALNISATSYKPGDVITGTLYSPSGDQFKGFLIEVGTTDNVDEEEKGVGQFVSLNDELAHAVCSGSGITHNNNDGKDMVQFTWKAPDQSQGDLSVRATVVQQFFPSKYWLGAFSTRIKAQ